MTDALPPVERAGTEGLVTEALTFGRELVHKGWSAGEFTTAQLDLMDRALDALDAQADRIRALTAHEASLEKRRDYYRERMAAAESRATASEAKVAGLVSALEPFAAIADIFDNRSSNRPNTGEVMAWEDHRVGSRVLTVEMLRNARAALSASAPAMGLGRDELQEAVEDIAAFDAEIRGYANVGYFDGEELSKAWKEQAAPAIERLRFALASGPGEASKAVQDVISERARQVSAEGWAPSHDDEHAKGELVAAAICYAQPHNHYVPPPEPVRYQAVAEAAAQARKELVALREWAVARAAENVGKPARSWPWHASWWKPKDARRDLVRSAALLIAEIERLDRAALATAAPLAVEGERSDHSPTWQEGWNAHAAGWPLGKDHSPQYVEGWQSRARSGGDNAR